MPSNKWSSRKPINQVEHFKAIKELKYNASICHSLAQNENKPAINYKSTEINKCPEWSEIIEKWCWKGAVSQYPATH